MLSKAVGKSTTRVDKRNRSSDSASAEVAHYSRAGLLGTHTIQTQPPTAVLPSLGRLSRGTAMGYAKYVGRVGALAFALGLGAAVATTTPAIAFADGTEPDPNVGTNQPNENNPAEPSPNTPSPDPTPPPAGETPPPGENNQQQQNNNSQTIPSGGEVRTAEPGEVLNTGGFQEEKKPEEKTPELTGTAPPPVVYVPPTPPVETPKDQIIPQAFLVEKGKSKDAELQQESGNKLKTTLNPELPQNNVEENNGAQLRRVKSLDETQKNSTPTP